MKDTVLSFAMFWLYLGPTMHKAYFKNEQYLGSDQNADEVEDRYAEILVQQKERKNDDSKITFEEYEKFLDRLDSQNKLDAVGSQNPKEIRLRADEEVAKRLSGLGKKK